LLVIHLNKQALQNLKPLQMALSFMLILALITSGIGCNSGSNSADPSGNITPSIQAASTPAITPNGGTFTTGFPTVAVIDTTPGAAIHFITDGSTPTNSSPTYTSAFTLSAAGNVQAIATASGYSASPVANAAFKLQAAGQLYHHHYPKRYTERHTKAFAGEPNSANPQRKLNVGARHAASLSKLGFRKRAERPVTFGWVP
jgi:hypothetical protein